MSKHNEKLQNIRLRNESKNKRILDEAMDEARLIGKEPFNLQELQRYWSFRYQNILTVAQVDRAMQDIERDYYLAGKRFMTMEQYGRYLIEIELYR
ncbi:hypothetical protein ABC502_09240 [Alkalimonas sp. NCh-2]|uniref:hypothetical protein n=1 Tax=Alkalimonas sp. NCh-2 TaxID=3144846 RepID=UPI0031F62574